MTIKQEVDPAILLFDAPEIRQRTMATGFEELVRDNQANIRGFDAKYRFALLGMYAVTEMQAEKPSAELQNTTFTTAIADAVSVVGRTTPIGYPRYWTYRRWRLERIGIYNSIIRTPAGEDLGMIGANHLEMYWLLKEGFLKFDPGRKLLV